ncbi:MAG: Flp family type IVb pilin [Alphaproteobacteria bacterium]
MKKMMNKFMANTDGATLIEYGLIAALIAVVLVAGLQGLQGGLTNTFQDVTNQL